VKVDKYVNSIFYIKHHMIYNKYGSR